MLASDLAGGSFPLVRKEKLSGGLGGRDNFRKGSKFFGQPTHHTLKPKMHGLNLELGKRSQVQKTSHGTLRFVQVHLQVAMLIFKISNDSVTQTSKPTKEIWFCICLFGRTSYYGED